MNNHTTSIEKIKSILTAMQNVATRCGCHGKLVIASYGQNPQTGKNLQPKVLHFSVDEPAKKIFTAITELNSEPHRNVYMPLGIYRQDLPDGKKGGEADLVNVLGFMADFDDGDADNWPGRVPVEPTAVLETSEGRYQALFLFSEPMSPDDAKPIAAMLQEYSGCDFGTKDLSHVWRIPGTLNYPNKKKVDGGRSPDPQPVKIIKPLNGYIDFDGLKTTLGYWHSQEVKRKQNSQQSSPTHVNTELYQWNGLVEDLPVKAETKSLIISSAPMGQRSEAMQTVINALVYANLDDGQIFSVFNLYPIGEKYRGQTNPAKWLQPQIEKARAYVTDRATQKSTRGQRSTGTLKGESKPFDITKFSLTGLSREMKKQMLEDRFIFGKMAILGQSTAFYAKPNTGKTLIVLKGLINGIKSGEIKGEDVIYVNADDTYKGLTYKLEIAEKYGFHMIAPSHSRPGEDPFKSEDLALYLKSMIEADQAKGKIFILDTVKKFTDLMSKNKCSEFGEAVRQFVSHGGSVIMLAHANKHRDDDKKIVYSGTADLVDDADCAYTIDVIQDDPNGLRTVKFENFKQRGDVALEAFYQYDYLPGTPYHERLDSVTAMDEEERKRVLQQQRLDAHLAKNEDAIEAITECIREGFTTKTKLVAEAHKQSGISRRKIQAVLKEHTGSEKSKNQFWHIEIGAKNSKNYQLNYGV